MLPCDRRSNIRLRNGPRARGIGHARCFRPLRGFARGARGPSAGAAASSRASARRTRHPPGRWRPARPIPTARPQSRWTAASPAPLTRLKKPKAVPRSSAGAVSATMAASSPCVMPMCRPHSATPTPSAPPMRGAGQHQVGGDQHPQPGRQQPVVADRVGELAEGVGAERVDDVHRHHHQRHPGQRHAAAAARAAPGRPR